MERRLAPQRLFASLTAAFALLGTYAANAAQPPLLTQEQMEGDPAAVVAWLRENASKADRKTATLFAKDGAKDRAKGRWSAGAKAYGESAIHYPDPVILLEYVRIKTLELASVRGYNKRPDLLASDAKSFLKTYQVVQAAESVLGTLSKDQIAEVDSAIRCLSALSAASQVPTDCEPLKVYRAEFDRASKRR